MKVFIRNQMCCEPESFLSALTMSHWTAYLQPRSQKHTLRALCCTHCPSGHEHPRMVTKTLLHGFENIRCYKLYYSDHAIHLKVTDLTET